MFESHKHDVEWQSLPWKNTQHRLYLHKTQNQETLMYYDGSQYSDFPRKGNAWMKGGLKKGGRKRGCFRRSINVPFLDFDVGYLVCSTCENMFNLHKIYLWLLYLAYMLEFNKNLGGKASQCLYFNRWA